MEYDVLVIGGGMAGIGAAKTAVDLGARVALAEHEKLGGTYASISVDHAHRARRRLAAPSPAVASAARVSGWRRAVLVLVRLAVETAGLPGHRRPDRRRCAQHRLRTAPAPTGAGHTGESVGVNQPVLAQLPPQRVGGDAEERGGLLAVPAAMLEDAQDVAALHRGER